MQAIPGLQHLRLISRGSFGSVWRARQGHFNRDVAVKLLDRPMIGRARSDFQAECSALGALSSHPHVVTVFQAGVDARLNRGWMVLELEPGGSLADTLFRQGPLSWTDVATIGVKMAGALETAHRASPPILHRDVKPANILLDVDGEPKLADFGVAVLGDAGADSVAGTVPFMPPEVLDRQAPTPSADVYSLAATLHTLLTGEPPFGSTASVPPEELRRRIATGDPAPLPQEVPAPIAEAILGALSKDPAQRPASAEAFGQRLQAAQADLEQPITTMVIRQPNHGETFFTELTVYDSPETPRTDEPRPPRPPRPPRRSLLVGVLALVAVAMIAGLLLERHGGTEAASSSTNSAGVAGPIIGGSADNLTTTTAVTSTTGTSTTGAVAQPPLIDTGSTTTEATVTTRPPTTPTTRPPTTTTTRPPTTPTTRRPSLTISGPSTVVVGVFAAFTTSSYRMVRGTWSQPCNPPRRPDWSPGDGFAGTWAKVGPCTLTLTAEADDGTTLTVSKTFEVVSG